MFYHSIQSSIPGISIQIDEYMYPMPLTANNKNSLPTTYIQFARLDDLMLC
jgi:hypothetical protein